MGPQLGGFFLWFLSRLEQLLPKSFLSWQAAPFLALWLERAAFIGLFLSVFVCVSRWLDSLALLLGYMRQKETQGTQHCTIPWVQQSLSHLPSSLYFSGSYACRIHNFQKFWLYLRGRVGKSASALSSWMLSHHRIFNPYSS